MRVVRLVVAVVAVVGMLAFAPAASAQNIYNCANFQYQEDAQAVYNQNTADPNRLDADNDGIACEQLQRRGGGGTVTTDDVVAAQSTAPQVGLPATGAGDDMVPWAVAVGALLLGAGVVSQRAVRGRV